MNKKLLILLTIIFSVNVYSQYIITYKKMVSLDFLSDNDVTKEAIEYRKYANNLNDILEHIEFELIFNDTVSSFKRIKTLDSPINKSIDLAANIGEGRGIYYTNLNSKIIIQQANAFGSLFLIKSNLTDLNWKITKESKLINGKKCYKAVLIYNDKSKIETYAWFCPEIPFNFGPVGFGNLPGLILELSLDTGYKFYAIKINKTTNSKNIQPPNKGKIVSKEQLTQIGKSLINNRSN